MEWNVRFNMKIILNIVLVFLFVLTSLHIGAQNPRDEYYRTMIETKEFDKAHWQKTIKEINYGEDKATSVTDEDYDEEFDIDEINAQENRRNKNNPWSGENLSSFWSIFLKILFVAGVLLIIAVLLISILGKGNIFNPSGKKINAGTTSFSLEQIEEKLHESDLDRFIREAVGSGNYALAIRLYYLAVIKELSLSKMIKWKRDKTNRDYLSETRHSRLYPAFRDATRVFERIWYGEHPLPKEEYEKCKPGFIALIEAVKENSSVAMEVNQHS